MIPTITSQPDWAQVQQRYIHWWQNELYDRALLQVTAPRHAVQPEPDPGAAATRDPVGAVTPATQWTDIEYMIRRMRQELRTTYYGAEALPLFYHNWSVGHALLLGCEPKFAPDTVWVDPLPAAADGYPPIQFRREGEWWRWMVESTRAAAAASQGSYYVLPVWGNHAGDTLALVRGTQQLLVDLLEDPDWVRAAVRRVSGILDEVVAALWQEASGTGMPTAGTSLPEAGTGLPGSVNYCGIWSPGRTLGFDCDISCCLSPAQFEEFFLPPLVESMRTVDHCIYHLDGTVALQHLDLLLAVPEIDAIQWVPGAGREEILQWVPLIRRIQAAGKSVLVHVAPAEALELLEAVSSRGLCMQTRCETQEQAEGLIEAVGKG